MRTRRIVITLSSNEDDLKKTYMAAETLINEFPETCEREFCYSTIKYIKFIDTMYLFTADADSIDALNPAAVMPEWAWTKLPF